MCIIDKTTYVSYVNIKNTTIFEVGKFAILWNVFEEKCRDKYINIHNTYLKKHKTTCMACDHETVVEKSFMVNTTFIMEEKGMFEGNQQPYEDFANELRYRAEKCCGKTDKDIEDYINSKLYPKEYADVSINDRRSILPLVIEFIKTGGTLKKRNYVAILAIYRIRNNMFHGIKGHSELDEQVELFRAMNAVLAEVCR